jgi:hypothetical protein
MDRELSEFGCDGWELDLPQNQPLIWVFRRWIMFSIIINNIIPRLMLMRANGHRFYENVIF